MSTKLLNESVLKNLLIFQKVFRRISASCRRVFCQLRTVRPVICQGWHFIHTCIIASLQRRFMLERIKLAKPRHLLIEVPIPSQAYN